MDHDDTARLARKIRALLPEPLAPGGTGHDHTLGDPMDIRGAARMIGCSADTIRRSLVPRGLPCFRTGPHGRLVFYKDQVARWIERNQRMAGGRP